MKKVLTVDDSITIRTVIKRTLTGAGYEVLEAPNGTEALKILADTELNLVISDYNMPGMNGLELLAEVKNNADYKKNKFVPFIMLTAVMGEDMKQHALAGGARAYLVKPFQPAQIIEIVQKLVP